MNNQEQQSQELFRTVEAKMLTLKTVKTDYFTASMDLNNAPYYVTDLTINAANKAKQDVYSMLVAMTIDKVMDNRNTQVERAINALPKNIQNQPQVLQQKLPLVLKAVFQKDSEFHKTEIGNQKGWPVVFFFDRQVLGNNNNKYTRKLQYIAGVAAVEIKWEYIKIKYPDFKQLLDNDFDAVEIEAIKVIEAAHAGALAYINEQNEIARKEVHARNNKINKNRVKHVS